MLDESNGLWDDNMAIGERHRYLLLAVVLVPSIGWGSDIYRWVDEQGRTNMAGAVPERYKRVATKVDSREFELSARQRSEGAERAAKDRSRLAEIDAARKASVPASGAPSAQVGPASRLSDNSGNLSECERLWKEYHASARCFNPYRLSEGGVKAEAFTNCGTPVLAPHKCPAEKWVGP